jgi:aminopeptidase C
MSIEAMKMALRDLTMLCHHRTQETVEALRQAIEQAEKREWVGLTDEEIQEIIFSIKAKTMGVITTEELSRLIEAKLKEKNT